MHILCERGQCALAMSMRIRCVYVCGQMTERRLARVATHMHAFKCESVLDESVKLLFVVCNRMRGCIYARLGMCECVHVHTLIRYFPFPRFMRISKDLGRHYVRSRVCKRHTHGVSELRTCVCVCHNCRRRHRRCSRSRRSVVDGGGGGGCFCRCIVNITSTHAYKSHTHSPGHNKTWT